MLVSDSKIQAFIREFPFLQKYLVPKDDSKVSRWWISLIRVSRLDLDVLERTPFVAKDEFGIEKTRLSLLSWIKLAVRFAKCDKVSQKIQTGVS